MLDLVVDVGSVLATVTVLLLLVLRCGGVLGHRPVRRTPPPPTPITPGNVEVPTSASASAGPVPAGEQAPVRAPAFA